MWGAVALGLAAISVHCSSPPTSAAQRLEGSGSGIGASQANEAASHEWMVGTLASVRDRSAEENIYTGTEVLADRRDELRSLRAGTEPGREARLRLAVGKDDLRLGNYKDAIAHFTASFELSGGMSPEAAFQAAVAFMRMGETNNCLIHADPESCILPIRGGGLHEDTSYSREAIRHLTAVLAKRPGHIEARWLLNLAHMTVGSYPDEVPERFLVPPESFVSEADARPFRNVAAQVGLAAVSLSGGVIADDFDSDGWLDVLVSDWSPEGQMRYFRNLGGHFVDRTEEAGLAGLFGGLNMIQADYDNDGDVDVFVMRGAWLEDVGRTYPNSLLSNDGTGRFRDVTLAAGLAEIHYPTQAAGWSDFDVDGDLDLYVGNEHFPGQLFRNEGDGTFTDVAGQAGVTNDDFAKAVTWGDYNQDGYPDLYVSNFGGPNRLYRNNGDGAFDDVGPDLGVDLPVKSFPAWFWDYNNDGIQDLYVSGYEWDVRDVAAEHMGLPPVRTERDRIYMGVGGGGFEEVGTSVGLTRTTQPMGANFGDINNDGFLDFYLGTGYPAYEGLMPNLLYRNEGGRRFVDITTAAEVGHLQKGHGVAFFDFDHDGDQDIFVELGGAFAGDAYSNAVFENPGTGNGWIIVQLVGGDSNRSAIGARIRVEIDEAGRKRSVFRWVNSGGSFGASPLRQHIGLGAASVIERLEIRWPGTAAVQEFTEVSPGQHILVREGTAGYTTLEYSRRSAP